MPNTASVADVADESKLLMNHTYFYGYQRFNRLKRDHLLSAKDRLSIQSEQVDRHSCFPIGYIACMVKTNVDHSSITIRERFPTVRNKT